MCPHEKGFKLQLPCFTDIPTVEFAIVDDYQMCRLSLKRSICIINNLELNFTVVYSITLLPRLPKLLKIQYHIHSCQVEDMYWFVGGRNSNYWLLGSFFSQPLYLSAIYRWGSKYLGSHIELSPVKKSDTFKWYRLGRNTDKEEKLIKKKATFNGKWMIQVVGLNFLNLNPRSISCLEMSWVF